MFAKRRLKLKFEILKNLDPFLRKILAPGEKVFFVSYGVLNTWVEQAFMGWAAMLLNRKAFVFTSTRIIMVQLKGKSKTWHLKSVIDYGAVARLKKTWTGQFRVKLNNGTTYSFVGVPKGDRKFIATTIQGLIDNYAQEKTRDGQKNLCPECGVAVPGFPPACPHCAQPFKRPGKAALLSLLFPGVGDFYLGHRGIAILEMLGAAIVWISLFIPEDDAPLTSTDLVVLPIIGFVFMHGIDSLVTRYVARKGLYPA